MAALLQDKVERFFGRFSPMPQYSRLGFKLLDSDPVLDVSRKLGFKVVEYDLPPYPLYKAGVGSIQMLSFIFGSGIVAYFLYHNVAKKSAAGKWFSILFLITALMTWPLLDPMSGVMLIDFWKPALGFRSSLLVWDIFQIRSVPEVESWGFARFFAQLWTFPKELDEIEERTREEGYARNPRIENIKGMPKVAVEAVALLVTLYFIPPYELTKDMSQLAYHCYCDALGLSILMALALFGDGLLKALGILINVEMADMFENPLGTTNIRLFWSHWNRAIATVLHRVVFGGGKSKTRLKKAKAAAAAEAEQKRRHLDQLSETDAGHTSGEDEDKNGRRSRTSSGLRPLSQLNGDAKLVHRKPNGSGPQKETETTASAKKDAAKSKGSFLPKAVAAIVTFAMSGIFHEHITYFTLGFANGENFLFFLANGVATVTATWFKRTFPEANARIPTLVSVLMLHVFFLAVIPLFCSPFIRSGFFIQLEALKYELLPIRARPRGSFVYLFGK
ncbi:uncharacterized protein PFL1_03447 [Pseudozyma flocculosa PF-1]|uniref:Wax synthase domain-containing protein n=2 Tax=Pseudozyma flocculosa TaxID=84751 RepID=A0A5C3FAT0_9BASI|nr:uncharacterized protein PFL1_03447 [Pseudozyma flocculosa PF-1]EPQ29160.1 hypothetical protein PFL1_03447 [Pseudozyma flocculosa PF-1]SPO41543.1 uncharacterized protein PSFLO_07025 [Pseudozyma flocculosa]